MDQQYYIVVDMKSLSGYLEFAKFYLGNDLEFSNELFSGLHVIDINDKAMALRVELLELRDGIDQVLQTSHCTLKQLKENCEVITKEVFKHFIF
jgi:hypothetical protein